VPDTEGDNHMIITLVISHLVALAVGVVIGWNWADKT
jgi:hypothetical protein